MTASNVDNSCNVGKGGAANREGRRGKQHNPSSQIKSIEVAHTQWQDKKWRQQQQLQQLQQVLNKSADIDRARRKGRKADQHKMKINQNVKKKEKKILHKKQSERNEKKEKKKNHSTRKREKKLKNSVALRGGCQMKLFTILHNNLYLSVERVKAIQQSQQQEEQQQQQQKQ